MRGLKTRSGHDREFEVSLESIDEEGFSFQAMQEMHTVLAVGTQPQPTVKEHGLLLHGQKVCSHRFSFLENSYE